MERRRKSMLSSAFLLFLTLDLTTDLTLVLRSSNVICHISCALESLRKISELGEGCGEETAPGSEMEGAHIPKRIVKAVADKLKKKKRDGHESGSSTSFFGLYFRGGGCRVSSCEELDLDCMKRLNAAEEDCIPRKTLLGFEKKSSGKAKGTEQCPAIPALISATMLPDDVLEIILVRLPLTSLMAARCVCKKWRRMTLSPHFLQLRAESPYLTPWLFLFGVTRDRCVAGEIQALDVSHDRWHRISHERLKGRSLFSAASIGTDLFVVGGRSSSSDLSLPLERGSFKTHKGVLVFSPVTGLCHKAAPMNLARSMPVLSVFEVGSNCSIFQHQINQQELLKLKPRVGAISDVYEDPHRFSVRRQLRDGITDNGNSHSSTRRSSKSVKQGRVVRPKFALIAVGGLGPWDEPLESGEVFDPVSNTWTEIAPFPANFGVVCSGAVCRGMFYVYSEAERLAGYDLERGFWIAIQISVPPPCLQEYYPKLVSCRSRLFLLSVSWCERAGQLNRRDKAVRKLWELDLVSHTWNETSRHPDAPMDWNAAFVADQDNIYAVEMFRIFGQVLDFLTACHISSEGLRWTRISRKHAAHEADVSSCMTKSIVVLHL